MRVISGKAKGTKLKSIDDIKTRPTLDRIKEALFNIIQGYVDESIVLDLFAGSGAIGIECISRGAQKVYFCDEADDVAEIIKENLEKTRLKKYSKVIVKDYKKCLEDLAKKEVKFDLIYVDPPYEKDIALESVENVINLDLLKEEGIMIVETDSLQRDKTKIEKLENINIYDVRNYGRIHLMFIKKK